MRRVGKGPCIAEYAFIPRFSEKPFQRFGNNRGGAGRDRSPRTQRRYARDGRRSRLAGSIDGAPDAPEMAGACAIAVVPPRDLHCVMG